jgi:hypothetical protein
LVAGLQAAENVTRKAKDLLRASRLELLPAANPDAAKELKRVSRGQLLSPVLLVRGRGGDSGAMIVAHGYHRICASYQLDAAVCGNLD